MSATVQAAFVQNENDWLAACANPVEAIKTASVTSVSAKKIHEVDIAKTQQLDRDIHQILTLIRKGQNISPEDRKTLSPLARKLSCEFEKLKLGTDNILRRQTLNNSQIVLPTKLRQLVYKHLHEDMCNVFGLPV
eukprot:gene14597-16105_t